MLREAGVPRDNIFVYAGGITEWSANGKHTSHTDLSLTEAGRERATALGSELAQWSFSLVLTSPLKRARETCELAGLSVEGTGPPGSAHDRVAAGAPVARRPSMGRGAVHAGWNLRTRLRKGK